MKDPRLIIASIIIVALGAFVFAERQSIQKLQSDFELILND